MALYWWLFKRFMKRKCFFAWGMHVQLRETWVWLERHIHRPWLTPTSLWCEPGWTADHTWMAISGKVFALTLVKYSASASVTCFFVFIYWCERQRGSGEIRSSRSRFTHQMLPTVRHGLGLELRASSTSFVGVAGTHSQGDSQKSNSVCQHEISVLLSELNIWVQILSHVHKLWPYLLGTELAFHCSVYVTLNTHFTSPISTQSQMGIICLLQIMMGGWEKIQCLLCSNSKEFHSVSGYTLVTFKQKSSLWQVSLSQVKQTTTENVAR